MRLGGTGGTFLDHQQLKIWINDVILPAIDDATLTNVQQRHPRSYDESHTKA